MQCHLRNYIDIGRVHRDLTPNLGTLIEQPVAETMELVGIRNYCTKLLLMVLALGFEQ